MNAQEKNALIQHAKTTMNVAIAAVIGDVFSGLLAAVPLMLAAAGMIRQTGSDEDAVQAEARAAECPAILAIPWPFIYIGSNTWIAAVARLRDSLPQFIELEPVNGQRQREASGRDLEAKAAQARVRWDALTEAQRAALADAGIDAERLAVLG